MKRVTFKTKIIFIKLSIETEKNILTYIVFFSLSKYLNEPHYETLIAIQIGIMEQTIAVIDKVGLKDSDHYNPNSCESFEQSNSVQNHEFKQNLTKSSSFSNIQDVIDV